MVDPALAHYLPVLSHTECRVLQAVASGMRSRDIAAALFVTVKDVEYHLSNLIRKFGVSNRAGVISKAFVYGYLSTEDWPPLASRSPLQPDPGGS